MAKKTFKAMRHRMVHVRIDNARQHKLKTLRANCSRGIQSILGEIIERKAAHEQVVFKRRNKAKGRG